MMILTDAYIRRVARMREGKLNEVPFAVLLYALARRRETVCLTIKRQQLAKTVIIDDGVPVLCTSNLVHESLARFMQSSGHLDEEVATECFNEACVSGKSFSDLLLERQLISPDDLLKVQQQNLARTLLDGFSWHHGSFRTGPAPTEVEAVPGVNVAQLIFIGVTRFATQEQIDGSIAPLIGRGLAVHPEPFFPRDEIRFSAEQLAVISTLDEQNLRIDELAVQSGMAYGELTRLLYALTLIGVVLPADQLPEPSPVEPTTIVQPDPDPAKPGLSPASREERAELTRLMLRYARKDAFELLGVDEEASPQVINRRFLHYAERSAPWRFQDDLKTAAREVFYAGARAYAELSDPELNAALIKKRHAHRQGPPPTGEAERFKIRTVLLDPEVQFKRGKALMEAGDYIQAIKQLEYASDLDPRNARYRVELAYCRFLHSPGLYAKTVFDQLDEALRLDPSCGLAFFYTGLALHRQGRIDEAEEAFQKAIKPMGPDRRPIEALRDLAAEKRSMNTDQKRR